MEKELELIKIIEELYENKKFQEIIKLIKENESFFQKKYYEVLEYKIKANIEIKDFFEAKRLVVNELDIPYIPIEFEKKLNSYLKEINFQLNDKKTYFSPLQIDELLDADDKVVMNNLQFLTEFNLNKYIKEFQYLLDRNDLSNITKSLLLAILADQNVDNNFHFSKNDKYFLYNPKSSLDMRDFKAYHYFMNYLKSIEKKMDINQYTFIKNLIEMYMLDLYPDSVHENEYELLIQAVISILNEIYKCEILHVNITNCKSDLERMIKKLNNLINCI